MCQLNLTSTLVTHTFWWRKVLKPEGEEQDPVPVCSAPPDGSRAEGQGQPIQTWPGDGDGVCRGDTAEVGVQFPTKRLPVCNPPLKWHDANNTGVRRTQGDLG